MVTPGAPPVDLSDTKKVNKVLEVVNEQIKTKTGTISLKGVKKQQQITQLMELFDEISRGVDVYYQALKGSRISKKFINEVLKSKKADVVKELIDKTNATVSVDEVLNAIEKGLNPEPQTVQIKIKSADGALEKNIIISKQLADKINKKIEELGENSEEGELSEKVRIELSKDKAIVDELTRAIENSSAAGKKTVTVDGVLASMANGGVIPPALENRDPNSKEMIAATDDKGKLNTAKPGQTLTTEAHTIGEEVKPIGTIDSIVGSGLEVPNFKFTAKKVEGKVITGAYNVNAINRIRERLASGEIKQFKATTFVSVLNDNGEKETISATREEIAKLKEEGKTVGTKKFRIKGGSVKLKKMVPLLDRQHLEQMYMDNLRGQSKLNKKQKIELLQRCVEQLARENPNIKPETIAEQILTYSKASAKSVYDKYKIEITTKDIMPESLRKKEQVSSEDSIGGSSDGDLDSKVEKVAGAEKKEVSENTDKNDIALQNAMIEKENEELEEIAKEQEALKAEQAAKEKELEEAKAEKKEILKQEEIKKLEKEELQRTREQFEKLFEIESRMDWLI